MERTVMAVFDSRQQAEAAWQDAVACGVDEDRVHLREGTLDDVPGAQVAEEAIRRAGWGDALDAEHEGQYREALRRGSFLVAVDPIPADKAVDVAAALSRHDPIDLDDRAAGWRERGWHGWNASAPRLSDADVARERDYDAQRRRPATPGRTAEGTGPAALATPAGSTTSASAREAAPERSRTPASTRPPDTTASGAATSAATGETTIPVVEEELAVGKRVVQRGGVRIYTRVAEQPVAEDVTLREEHAHVERRDVDRAASQADLATAFKEGTLEIRETAEEPVVSKQARVVGEVEVGKDVTERTEKVKDTVRRTDVEVEDLPASRKTDTGGTSRTTRRR